MKEGYITAKDIIEKPEQYYGRYVNYNPINECPVKWRIYTYL